MTTVRARSLVLLLLAGCADSDPASSGATLSGSGQITSVSQGLTQADSEDSSGGGSEGSSGDQGGSESDSAGSTSAASSDSSSSSGDTSDSSSAGTTTGEPTSSSGSSDSDSDSDSEGSCAEVKVMAENKKTPADIIFAIDNSGSMDYEEAQVQSNMNVFSNKIIQSGVDAHVVLISNNDICINAPLGSGQCPNDTNPPKYLHVNVGVGSNDALAKILSTHEQWKDAMRPDGKKHVIVVSDDNASGVVASSFHSMFQALGPSYTGYFFHAIVGTWDVGDFLKCAADAFCCATIADEGKEYKKLVSMTGGVLGPLCEGGKQKFNELFDALSKDVIEQAPILCEWTIPEPMGMELDFGKVNVDYLDGKGGSQAIPKVDDLNACGGLDAWYYDDNAMPTKIFACPALCSKIQGNADAQVDVKFGCESIVPQ
jgi:hypothetical protein